MKWILSELSMAGTQWLVQLQSHVWFFVTSWTATCQAPLSFPISCSLLKFISIELVMLSNHLVLCLPLLLSIFPIVPGVFFSIELALHMRWPKYWSFSISPSNDYTMLISFHPQLSIISALAQLFHSFWSY